MALMTDKRVRHLPVLEGQKVTGLVSIGDLVKSIISDQKFIIDNLNTIFIIDDFARYCASSNVGRAVPFRRPATHPVSNFDS